MNKKWLPYLLIIALGVILLVLKFYKRDTTSKPGTKNTNASTKIDRNRGFDRRITYLEYTRHATCRMSCRKITQAEVQAIMKEGKINYNKSNVRATPCPTYALEGVTDDDQRVRIVFGQCDEVSKVITVIDLETEWSCDCPGDDGKYKNKK